jgi:quercetin dioxygenase-like cupin family protein
MFENYDLFESVIQLRSGAVAEPADRPAALRNADGESLWTVSAFHADNDQAVHADHWERHPDGYEVIVALSGVLRVHLRDQPHVITLTAGKSFIVPPGQWHRLTIDEPGDLLSITPRAGTEHDRVAP